MADVCIRCGKQADGVLCPECAAPPVKKAKVEPPKPAKLPDPVVIAEPVIPPVVLPVAALPPRVVAPPKPQKAPKPPKAPKSPKTPKPAKVKRQYSPESKRKARQLIVVVVIAAVVFAFLPQIKSGFNSAKDFVASKFSNDAETTVTASPTETPTESPTPAPSETPSQTPTESPTPAPSTSPTQSPTPTKTKPANNGAITTGARNAVNESLKNCAKAVVYAPPGCPFAETTFIHGTSVDWSLSGTPKITLVSDKAGVQTLKVSGKAIAHVHYGKRIRDVDNDFTRTAIATPSGTTYTIKWK